MVHQPSRPGDGQRSARDDDEIGQSRADESFSRSLSRSSSRSSSRTKRSETGSGQAVAERIAPTTIVTTIETKMQTRIRTILICARPMGPKDGCPPRGYYWSIQSARRGHIARQLHSDPRVSDSGRKRISTAFTVAARSAHGRTEEAWATDAPDFGAPTARWSRCGYHESGRWNVQTQNMLTRKERQVAHDQESQPRGRIHGHRD